MSTTKTATSYKLSLGVENGVNALGAAQVKSVSVGSVKLDAADDKCLAVCGQCHERADEPRSGQRLRYGKGRAGSGGMIL